MCDKLSYKDKMKLVSIILPTYNGEKYIQQAIDSILKQTYQNIELIIVDDCSKDRTSTIVQEYAKIDDRIHIIKNDINQKLPSSLNIGFSQAHGDYYTWTSDDNLYYENAIEKMALFLDNNEKTNFVYACEEFIDENGIKIGFRQHPKDMDEMYCNNIVSACFLYRKKVHSELGGYDTNKFLIEDYDFFRRAYIRWGMSYIPEILYSYRRHSGSLSETKMIEVRKRKIELLEESLKDNLSDKIINKIYRELSDSYYEISDLYKENLLKKQSQEYNHLRRPKIKDAIIYNIKNIKRGN